MPDYAARDIATAHSRDVPRDFLQSLMICELMAPSRPLWVVSPWISDVVLIDNSARQFSTLSPAWPAGEIRFQQIIRALLERGGEVTIVVNEDLHNGDFARRIAPMLQEYSGMRFARAPDLHVKGIVSRQFCLDGSMNLTHSGVYRNDEHLIYRTDPKIIDERRLELDAFWRKLQ